MKLGIAEILVILVVILFVIGPDKIPEFAKKVAEGLRAFRSATSGVTKEIRENVIEPLNEAQAPLREALEPFNEIRAEIGSLTGGIKQDAQEIADSLNSEIGVIQEDLGKTGKSVKDAAEKAVEEARATLKEEADSPAGEEAPAEETPREDPRQAAARRVEEAEKALKEAREALARTDLSEEPSEEDKETVMKEETL
ncbi:MAG: twin-arginine translocase TatA/TatE family subunit [Lachnospiraceae bacterium]|nr:twin-arginine translocase TatA/TatE family subunit [Lachnospiraceae bacterium]